MLVKFYFYTNLLHTYENPNFIMFKLNFNQWGSSRKFFLLALSIGKMLIKPTLIKLKNKLLIGE